MIQKVHTISKRMRSYFGHSGFNFEALMIDFNQSVRGYEHVRLLCRYPTYGVDASNIMKFGLITT